MLQQAEDSHPAPDHVSRDDGESIVHHVVARKPPGMVLLTGFKSGMTGGHRLSESEDLNRLCRTVDQLPALVS
jgi:hypothetical protein